MEAVIWADRMLLIALRVETAVQLLAVLAACQFCALLGIIALQVREIERRH